MLFSLPWLSFLSIAVSPSDPVALIVDLLENIVYQSCQLVFKNHNQTDQYHQDQNDLHNSDSVFFLQKCSYMFYMIFLLFSGFVPKKPGLPELSVSPRPGSA